MEVNRACNLWKDIFYGVPQGPLLGPLFFNTHLCGLFYFLESTDTASYADDSTLYSAEKNKGLFLIG